MLNFLDEILVEYHALTYVSDSDILVGVVYGLELLAVKVDGSKSQNIVRNVGKAARIRACGEKERQ